MVVSVLTGLTMDLLSCICVCCGWSTALRLSRASRALSYHWSSMSRQRMMEVQSTVVLVGCGYTDSGESAHWDRLSLWTESAWERLFTVVAPRPRLNSACVFDGGRRIFILGGEDHETDDDEECVASGVAVDSFDLVHRVWVLEADMVTARSDFGASCVLSELIAIGGVNHDDDVLDSVDVCDLGTGLWHAGARLQTARYNFGLVKMGSSVYVIGGLSDDGDIVPTIEVVSDHGRAIRILTSVPEPVTGCMATVRGAKLLVIAGQVGDQLSDSALVQEFDFSSSSWAQLQFLPFEVSSGLYFRSESGIHVFGGDQNEGAATDNNDVEAILNESTGRWMTRRSPWDVVFGVAVWLDFSIVNCRCDVRASSGCSAHDGSAAGAPSLPLR